MIEPSYMNLNSFFTCQFWSSKNTELTLLNVVYKLAVVSQQMISQIISQFILKPP